MASEFLENLKKSVETGEFNSEAAKKITNIGEQADGITEGLSAENHHRVIKDIEKSMDSCLDVSGVKTVTEEEATEANSKYEAAMKKIKEEEAAMKVIATLTDIETMIADSITDMFDYITNIESAFNKENNINDGLYKMVDSIKTKYKSFII